MSKEMDQKKIENESIDKTNIKVNETLQLNLPTSDQTPSTSKSEGAEQISTIRFTPPAALEIVKNLPEIPERPKWLQKELD